MAANTVSEQFVHDTRTTLKDYRLADQAWTNESNQRWKATIDQKQSVARSYSMKNFIEQNGEIERQMVRESNEITNWKWKL